MLSRRGFLRGSAAAAAALACRPVPPVFPAERSIIKPPRLKPGDTVGLVDPASATWEALDVEIVRDTLAVLGLKVKQGPHLLDRRGYLAGRDEDRAADLNAFFKDGSVQAVLAVRGGWGSARLLPLVDYDAIRRRPKVLLGFSDVTALHLAIHARTGLVTFHGPVGSSAWTPFTADYVRRVVIDGEAVIMRNPTDPGERIAQAENRVQTITPGTARGRLVGGNLTVLAAIVGSSYLPSFDGAILFLEDVHEQPYRLDRMLTQLSLAGLLKRIRGFVFGQCSECDPGEGYGSLTLEEILADHIKPLGVPAWRGAMIGHIDEQFTMPIGVEVEIDATAGTIKMLESAVV